MKTKLILIVVAFGLAAVCSRGGILFTGYDADSDVFSFFSTTTITSGTEIFFTDDEWNGTSFADNSEGTISLLLSANLNPGNEVIITEPSLIVSGASGTVTQSDAGFALSGSGDSVYAFTGSRISPTFIGFITTSGDTAPGTSYDLSLTSLNGTDVFAYTGPTDTQSTFDAYTTLVANASNWTAQGDGTGSQSANFDPPGNFAIPEPSTFMLVTMAGLAAISVLRRRK